MRQGHTNQYIQYSPPADDTWQADTPLADLLQTERISARLTMALYARRLGWSAKDYTALLETLELDNYSMARAGLDEAIEHFDDADLIESEPSSNRDSRVYDPADAYLRIKAMELALMWRGGLKEFSLVKKWADRMLAYIKYGDG